MEKNEVLRNEMVASQIINRGISDPLILAAMRKVPRHKFFINEFLADAYEDGAYPIGERQTISQPYIVALMTELMELKGGETVLEIGTGSGYQAAILADIAKQVYTIERNEILAKKVRPKLESLNIKNVEIFAGDGTLGLPEHAPYDAIMVTAAAPDVPPPLIEQLKEGGRIVIPVGGPTSQTLKVFTKTGGKITSNDSIQCIFVPLNGKYGW